MPAGGWLSLSPAHLYEFSCAVNFSVRTKQWGAMVNLEVVLHHSQKNSSSIFHGVSMGNLSNLTYLWSMQLICVDQGMGHLWRKHQHLWGKKKSLPGARWMMLQRTKLFLAKRKAKR